VALGESNPFLIPPPPPGSPKPSATAAPAVAPESLIEIPPTIAPIETGSGTQRIAPSIAPIVADNPAPATAEAPVVFFPTLPGTAALSKHAWELQLPDGRTIPVARAVFFGRNPARTPERPGADLLPLDDPARSLSKTHALLELDSGELWIHDLDSTNGVVVASPGASPIVAIPGERVAVGSGSELRLGSYVIRVSRVE
jgi:hypothetical protein